MVSLDWTHINRHHYHYACSQCALCLQIHPASYQTAKLHLFLQTHCHWVLFSYINWCSACWSSLMPQIESCCLEAVQYHFSASVFVWSCILAHCWSWSLKNWVTEKTSHDTLSWWKSDFFSSALFLCLPWSAVTMMTFFSQVQLWS